MPGLDSDRLRAIRTFPSLVKYLRDELDWPIETNDFDDLTFQYEAEELGIDPRTAAKIQEIKQLRPLTTRQPWGIFFLKFEPKRLPVVALRRILSQLVVKKRASVRQADQPSWHLDDLLFISNYGEGEERQITFAHFSQDEEKQDLPTLKVLGWDNQDTPLHLDDVAEMLARNLVWPRDENNTEAWRKTWRSAFVLRHREVITTSRDLSVRLAELARAIRDRIKTALAIETDRGPLTKLMKAFQEALVHDLDADGFADMYAQTIAYGLLSARVANPKATTADHLPAQMPVTNPFLKELMETFLQVGGRRGKTGGSGIDFDELGVSEVVELLDDAKMEAVLRDFGDRNPQEDPVTHFYEGFAKEYDPIDKVKRGEFYTPRPVVSYIVRSVDELLRTEFALTDGLADTTTWGEMSKRHIDLKIPDGIPPAQDFVQILDPATGTGTFLVEVIDIIHKTLVAKWKAQGHGEKKIEVLWNSYVPEHLLPRLHAYELKMAPYAIAHLKIGLKLYETGYRFGSEERARIYLTNALELAHDSSGTFEFAIPALAHEAKAVNEIKRNHRFTVVIGNPPYSGESANSIPWVRDLVKSKYEYIEGRKIEEKGKKNWLLNDYVKFIRLAHFLVERSPMAVIGLITPHSYLDNPTFRAMRYSLIKDFETLYLVDLHGNYDKREKCPDGSKDENVFDITQGVCISTFLKKRLSDPAPDRKCRILLSNLWGLRELVKYPWLSSNNCSSHEFSQIEPDERFFFFRQGGRQDHEYESWWPLNTLFEVNGNGVITAHDHFSIAFDDRELAERLDIYVDPNLSDAEVLDKLQLRENSMWEIGDARQSLRRSRSENRFVDVLYRPFDVRRTYFHKSVVFNLRLPVMKHIVAGSNLALICSRMTKGELFAHAFVSRNISEAILLSSKTSNNAFSFPLNLRIGNGENDLFHTSRGRFQCNISARLLSDVSSQLSVKGKANGSPTPNDVFDYVYAVLYSPGYRRRYAEFLQTDFPRLPLTRNLELFRALVRLGGELVALHLMESPKLDCLITTYTGPKSPEIERVGWSDDTVWLDAAATQKGQPATLGTIGFRGVPEDIWNFHIGGYQVCEKWLKDRKGRKLSAEDIAHYQRIVVALSETIRLMEEIDEVIAAHGGWPGAFVTDKGEFSGEPSRLSEVEHKREVPHAPEEPDSLPLTEKVAEQKVDSGDGNSSSEDQDSEDEQGSIYDTTREEGIAAIREIFSANDRLEGMDRETAIREVAKLMGFDRLGPRIREFIDGDLTAAAHRGIIRTEQGILRLDSRSVNDYSRDSLKGFLLSTMGTTWWDQDDAIRAAARHLGFRRTGSTIQDAFKSAINGAIRQGLIERNGMMLRAIR